MRYTSMRYASTALSFYKQFTQAPNKIFLKHFMQKICIKNFYIFFLQKFLSK